MVLKIKPNKILMWLSYNCLFFSIMLKMLYQTNQNSTIRLLGFGMQVPPGAGDSGAPAPQ